MQHFTALVCRKIHTQLAKNKLLQGDIHSNNDIKLKKSKKNKVVGNLFAVDDIDIGKKNDIDDNVTAGHKVDNDGDVSGVITENAGVTVVPPPVIATFTTGTLDVEVEKKDTETITPGAFDDVEVDKEGTLNLSSGVYSMESLELKKKS